MRIVLTCGHPHSGFTLVHQTLVANGLTPARPSRREGFLATELNKQVLHSHGVAHPDRGQIVPLSPGKAWEDLAVDLIIGNLSLDQWGFADSNLVWLLDFWKQLDPQIRFLLVYCEPERALARVLRARTFSSEDFGPEMESWVSTNIAMLRFFNRNRSNCMLVNADRVPGATGQFIHGVCDAFGMSLAGLGEGSDLFHTDVSHLATLLARQVIGDNPEIRALYTELESSADFWDDSNRMAPLAITQAIAEHQALLLSLTRLQRETENAAQAAHQVQEQVSVLTSELDERQAQIGRLSREKDELSSLALGLNDQLDERELVIRHLKEKQTSLGSLQSQLQEQVSLGRTLKTDLEAALGRIAELTGDSGELALARGQIDKATGELSAAQEARVAAEAALAACVTEKAEQTAENQLLLAQLHQVQEELEGLFIRSKDLEQAVADAGKTKTALNRARDELSRLTKALDDRQAQLDLLQREKDEFLTLVAGLNKQLGERDSEIQRLQEKERSVDSLQSQLQGQASLSRGLKADLEGALGRVAELTRDASELALAKRRIDKLTGELRAAQEAQAAAESALAARAAESSEQTSENQQLLVQLHQVQEELERLVIAKAELESASAVRAHQESEQVEKNRQLLLQLHQASDELDHYLEINQSLEARLAGAPSEAVVGSHPWGDLQPVELLLDLRGEITGENWYYAESDGRWAGPGTVSTLTLPPLPSGRYEIRLDIVDTMAPEILAGMRLSVNGAPLDLRLADGALPAIGIATYVPEGLPIGDPWILEFGFPFVVSPAAKGSDDQRNLSIRLRSMRIVAVSDVDAVDQFQPEDLPSGPPSKRGSKKRFPLRSLFRRRRG